MTKRKKNKKKHSSMQRTLKDGKSNTSGSRRSISSKLWMLGKFFMVALAIWSGGYLTLKPRIDVRSGDAYDSNNPVTIPFIIKNQGYVSIYDVKSSSSMNVIRLHGDITIRAEVPFANSFSDPKQVAKIIAPGEGFTIVLPYIHMENNKFEESDIAIRLTFKPIKWLPWQYETIHRFVSVQNKDGRWKWHSQPIDK